VLGARAADEGAFELALQWWAEERFGYWDALILATSLRAGATAVVSEDLADGMILGGVEVVSPFAPDALDRIAVHGLRVAEARA
jgi:predicted nucleic acid-binding protein